MKLALIPPLCRQEDMQGDYHLMLPQLLEHPGYAAWFKRMLMNQHLTGSYTILDNGAAEGMRGSTQELLKIAWDYQVQEFVIPDVLADGPRTVECLEQFFHLYEPQLIFMECGMPEGLKLGFVAQGRNRHEALLTINAVMNGPWAPYISVVYLPRLLISESGRIDERLSLAHDILSYWGNRLEQHFLGASTLWPEEPAVATRFEHIRGMDTSLPYTLAAAGWHIENFSGTLDRPESYFTRPYSEKFHYMADYNVRVLKEWISGPDSQKEAPTS